MDSKKYNALLIASECGSISLAAQKIGCTQSALSHMIERMEKEIGVTLLTREKGNIRLSDFGKKLEPAIADLLQAEQALIAEIDTVRKMKSDCILVVSCSELAENYLPEVISAFSATHPGLDLELKQCNDPKLMNELLCSHRADIAFCSHPMAECDWSSLGRSQLFAVLPQTAQGEAFSKHLSGKKIVLPTTVDSEEIVRFLKNYRAAPQVSTTTLDYLTIVQMVEHHLAISVLPGLCMQKRNANIALLPIEPHLYQEYGVATSKEMKSSEVSMEFLSFAAQRLSAQIA